jgi:hypothetical protein
MSVKRRGGPPRGIEGRLIAPHRELGVDAERFADGVIDIYVGDRERAPLVGAVMSHRSGKAIADSLADFDALFIARPNDVPLVVLPWTTWATLLKRR